MTLDEFTDNYHQYITHTMDKDGFRLAPLHALAGDGTLHVAAMMLPPKEIYSYFWSIVTGTDEHIKAPQAVIFGIDRFTQPNQGTEFADVLACLFWWNDPIINWGKSLKVGVINYQHEPRIIRPWDWDNVLWNSVLREEAYKSIPPFRIKTLPTSRA